MSEKNTKQTKSVRLSHDAIELLARAADESGLSEGDLIEAAIVEKVQAVVDRHLAQKQLLRAPEAAAALADATGRDRQPRADRGKKKAKMPAGLSKTQQS